MFPQPFLDLVLLGWRDAREDQPPDSRAVMRLFNDGRIQNEATVVSIAKGCKYFPAVSMPSALALK